MKMIKKVLAAVLAMAMVIGMMAMSAFATEVKVTVKWDGQETVNAWCWDDIENYTAAQAWPGDAMTKEADGVFSFTADVNEDTFSFIANCEAGQTMDIINIPANAGEVTLTITDVDADSNQYAVAEAVKNDAGKLEYQAAAGGDSETGDSSVMVYVVAAVVAVAAAVTVVCKRRSVEA